MAELQVKDITWCKEALHKYTILRNFKGATTTMKRQGGSQAVEMSGYPLISTDRKATSAG